MNWASILKNYPTTFFKLTTNFCSDYHLNQLRWLLQSFIAVSVDMLDMRSHISY